MITTHTEALDYCRHVLDELGASGVVREKVEQRIGDDRVFRAADPSSREGMLMFLTNKDLTDAELKDRAWGNTRAQVGYTLPCEPGALRRKIILNYAPSSIRELA